MPPPQTVSALSLPNDFFWSQHGDSIEHHIDIAANESRVGSTEIRKVKREGNRLTYTTKPQPFSGDGKMSVITLVWEKMN
jgi:hypothetical protein